MLLENINHLQAFRISSAILSIGLIIDTVNFFIKKELYHDQIGLFQYNKLVLDKKRYFSSICNKFPTFFSFEGYYKLMLIRLICSLILFSFISYHWIFYIILFIIQLLFNIRNAYSLSGADQMQTIILFGLMIFSLRIDNTTSLLTLYFIVLQLLLSYFFTGYHKIGSEKWRNGNALLLVLNSETFGNSFFQKILYKNKFISITFSWIIILVQLTFIFSFFLYPELTIYYLFALFFFHLNIAFFMGLNHFFWVFVSCYPIIFYLSKNILWNYLF